MDQVADVALRVRMASAGLALGTGRGYIGEPVSQLEHALQCAALARDAHAATDEVLAALFHDIGHLIAPPGSAEMDGLGVLEHEAIGARWLLELGFDARVAKLVGSHVEAKRYLTRRKAGYYERLSDASRGTLAFQGGVMSEQEALAFEADPMCAAKLRLRVWDEAAKDPDLPVPGLDDYADLIRSHLEHTP